MTAGHDQASGGRPRVPTPLASASVAEVNMAELLAALSHALDLTEGSPPGHTLRSCVLAMRLAHAISLSADDATALYYAVLLKDSGCSSNAARVSALFGSDDRTVKPRMKALDDDRLWPRLRAMMALTAPDEPLWSRVRYLIGMPRPSAVARELMQIRCDRGSLIARGLGFPDATAAAIAALDEHWNGGGYPHALMGAGIPVLSRIIAVVQTFDLFLRSQGPDAAYRMLRERRGRWFDPALVDVMRGWEPERDFWRQLVDDDQEAAVQALAPPAYRRQVSEDGIDTVAQAFADIIDAKSPFTYRHSSNVSRYAVAAGTCFTDDPRALRRLRRAGLLHDIGKLGVSNSILDKNGPLSAGERLAMQLHPQHTWDILSGVAAFRDFAMLAAVHHEKLDGSGYPWGFGTEELGDFERILAVADIFEALTATRPYRASMSRADAFAIIERDRDVRLWGPAIDALADTLHTLADAPP